MRPPLEKYFEQYPRQASALANGIVAGLVGAWIYVTPGGSFPAALATGIGFFVAGSIGTIALVRYRLRRRD